MGRKGVGGWAGGSARQVGEEVGGDGGGEGAAAAGAPGGRPVRWEEGAGAGVRGQGQRDVLLVQQEPWKGVPEEPQHCSVLEGATHTLRACAAGHRAFPGGDVK